MAVKVRVWVPAWDKVGVHVKTPVDESNVAPEGRPEPVRVMMSAGSEPVAETMKETVCPGWMVWGP